MNNILKKYLNVFVIIYLDNIVVYSGVSKENIKYIN